MDKDAQKFVDKFYENHPKRKIIFLIYAGSYFFNLNTETSDKDFRGIYMPSLREFYKGESKRSMIDYSTSPGNKKNKKNTNQDVDFTLFSITKFLNLLKSGDFNMMEMLHTPEDKIIIDSPELQELREFRSSLLINDISSFLGFIKKEYKRYGINIHHYERQVNFVKFLKSLPVDDENKIDRIKDFWKDVLKYKEEQDPTIKITESRAGNRGGQLIPSFVIANRMYHRTVKVEHVIEQIQQNLGRYGHRQRNMAKEGVEFKGLYHAMRLIYETNDLFDHGEMKLPFDKKRHEMLMKIKTSNIEQEKLFNFLDNCIETLYNREKEVVCNRKQVENIIDKAIFQLQGRKKIEYLIKGV